MQKVAVFEIGSSRKLVHQVREKIEKDSSMLTFSSVLLRLDLSLVDRSFGEVISRNKSALERLVHTCQERLINVMIESRFTDKVTFKGQQVTNTTLARLETLISGLKITNVSFTDAHNDASKLLESAITKILTKPSKPVKPTPAPKKVPTPKFKKIVEKVEKKESESSPVSVPTTPVNTPVTPPADVVQPVSPTVVPTEVSLEPIVEKKDTSSLSLPTVRIFRSNDLHNSATSTNSIYVRKVSPINFPNATLYCSFVSFHNLLSKADIERIPLKYTDDQKEDKTCAIYQVKLSIPSGKKGVPNKEECEVVFVNRYSADDKGFPYVVKRKNIRNENIQNKLQVVSELSIPEDSISLLELS